LERHEYERLAAVEEQGWWFRGLRANLIAAWQRAASTSPLPALLDAGCGTGGLLARLAAARPEAHRFGIDLDPLAAATAQRKSGALIAIASTMALPFASDAFDAISMFSAIRASRRDQPCAASITASNPVAS
jgi:SAM-dependent methyltransferase